MGSNVEVEVKKRWVEMKIFQTSKSWLQSNVVLMLVTFDNCKTVEGNFYFRLDWFNNVPSSISVRCRLSNACCSR